ncbi:MAG: hypothetical protein P4L22_03605 [Candidatus Babeliales bacterium]|nr:hypothetical protein [Candidatus Babeliales bacterium]
MKNNNGSCILLVTVIFSIILIFSLNLWQSIIFNSDLVQKQYEYEFNFRMLEGLHNFGVFKCLNNYRNASKNKNPNNGTVQSIMLYNGPWPIESTLELMKLSNPMLQYNSIITLTLDKEIAIIKSKLINLHTSENYFMESKLKKITMHDEDINTQKTRFLIYDLNF